MAEALISCTKCKKRIPMSQMRYSPDGEDLVCQACLASMTGKPALSQPKPTSATPTVSTALRQPTSFGSSLAAVAYKPSTSLSSASKPVKYHCMSCNYTFSRASKTEVACPYCNRRTLRKEFRLVSDVDELMGHLNTF